MEAERSGAEEGSAWAVACGEVDPVAEDPVAGAGRERIRIPIESLRPRQITLPQVLLFVLAAHVALIGALLGVHWWRQGGGTGANVSGEPVAGVERVGAPAMPGEMGEPAATDAAAVMGSGPALGLASPPATSPEPMAAVVPSAPRAPVHVVRRGETLARIARRYGVTVEDLARANRIVDRDKIRIGARLAIPGGARVAATGTGGGG